MQDELENESLLLGFMGNLFNSILDGLSQLDLETRMQIMELCGETCAAEKICGSALEIAKKISEEEVVIDRILQRVNREILWCGAWFRESKVIRSRCSECGCLLVKNKLVKLTGTLCYCSRGWIKKILGTLFRRDVRVELEKSIGLGDGFCEYAVYI